MDNVKVYDGNMRLLAVLDNADDIGYSLVHNDLWTGDFSLPTGDSKSRFIQPGALVTISDGERATGLYRVSSVPDAYIGSDQMTTYHVEHVLSTLLDDIIFGTLDVTDQAPADAIRQVLSMQTVQRWVLETCDYTQPVTVTLGNETLLSALQKVCGQLPDEYTWSFDTTRLPWVLHVRHADTGENCGIHYARNLVEIRKTVDASQIVTRLYLLGGSDTSGQQVTVESLTAGGVPYIDADTIPVWGVKSAIYQNGDLVTPEALLARGREVLESRKNPCYSYEATALDLYQLTGYEWDRYEPGKRVLVMDDERGIHFAARIVSVSKRDVRGDPGSITITIANQPRDELGTVTAIAQKAQQVEMHAIRNTMEMRGINDRVTTIDGTVSYLTHTAEGLRHAISTNTGTLSVLENTLNGLKHQVQDEAGNLSTLTNTVEGMSSTVKRVDGTVSTLTNTAEGLKHQIADNAGKLSTLENTIDGLKHQVTDGAGNLSTLTNTVEGMTSTVKRVDGTVSTLTNTAEGLKHQIADNAGKLSTLENAIDGLKHQVTDGAGNLSTLTNTIEGMTATVKDVDGRTAQFKVRVDKIEGTVHDENGNSRITQLAGRVDIEAQRNDGQDSTINLKADKTYVDKLIADEIKAMRGDFNNLISGVTTASSLYTNSLGCQYGRITNLEVANHAAPWQSLDVLTDVKISVSTATSPMFYNASGQQISTITYVKSVTISKTTAKMSYLGRSA